MKFAVITFPGTGCEQETARAIREVAKEEATIVWHRDGGLDTYDAIVIPSGAAYGDYLRPGALAKSSPSPTARACCCKFEYCPPGISCTYTSECGLFIPLSKCW